MNAARQVRAQDESDKTFDSLFLRVENIVRCNPALPQGVRALLLGLLCELRDWLRVQSGLLNEEREQLREERQRVDKLLLREEELREARLSATPELHFMRREDGGFWLGDPDKPEPYPPARNAKALEVLHELVSRGQVRIADHTSAKNADRVMRDWFRCGYGVVAASSPQLAHAIGDPSGVEKFFNIRNGVAYYAPRAGGPRIRTSHSQTTPPAAEGSRSRVG